MRINLDINRSEPILETINLRQGDGGLRTIDIQITENNQPIVVTGYTLQFEANLPSGPMVQHAGVIKDATAGLFSYTFTSSDTSEAGQLPVAYFRLYDSAKNSVATRNIRIVVDRAADITQPQANDYLAKINQLITDSEAKLAANNQQIAAQQTQIDSIKANGIIVGGRNLYLNSKAIEDHYDNIGAVKLTVEPFDSTTNMWHIVSEQGSGGGGVGVYSYGYAKEKLPDTTVWSYSADVKGIGKPYIFGIDGGNRNPVIGTVGSEWSRISQTGRLVNSKLRTVAMYFDTNSSPLDVYIKLPKLEAGNIPTDWTPAPEDMATKSWAKSLLDVQADKIAALEQIVLNQ